MQYYGINYGITNIKKESKGFAIGFAVAVGPGIKCTMFLAAVREFGGLEGTVDHKY